MFRNMSRPKQKLEKSECIEILESQKRGVLSVIGDGGYPYGVPLNHYYNNQDGKIYFHTGKHGHKIDALKKCNLVSYCVFDEGQKYGDDWALNFKSVIVFGKIEFVEDRETIYDISEKLSHKFTDDEQYIRNEIEKYGPVTMMFALTPQSMSGKKIKES